MFSGHPCPTVTVPLMTPWPSSTGLRRKKFCHRRPRSFHLWLWKFGPSTCWWEDLWNWVKSIVLVLGCSFAEKVYQQVVDQFDFWFGWIRFWATSHNPNVAGYWGAVWHRLGQLGWRKGICLEHPAQSLILQQRSRFKEFKQVQHWWQWPAVTFKWSRLRIDVRELEHEHPHYDIHSDFRWRSSWTLKCETQWPWRGSQVTLQVPEGLDIRRGVSVSILLIC